mmetsp:Transcript_10546/g.39773  ORF Transcript_10546/g.39773 Transcript_10546/m.39773 type:complete len:200 (-) Transcript_10546:309-908(-)
MASVVAQRSSSQTDSVGMDVRDWPSWQAVGSSAFPKATVQYYSWKPRFYFLPGVFQPVIKLEKDELDSRVPRHWRKALLPEANRIINDAMKSGAAVHNDPADILREHWLDDANEYLETSGFQVLTKSYKVLNTNGTQRTFIEIRLLETNKIPEDLATMQLTMSSRSGRTNSLHSNGSSIWSMSSMRSTRSFRSFRSKGN